MTPPRVVLADDSALFREGLAALLTVAGVDVVAQTDAAEEIEHLVGTHRPDVLVTDVRMPPRQVDEGLQAARLVRRRHPGVGVVILSQHVDVEHALDILADRQGGVGYLLKDHVANIDELRDAIERVMARDFVFDRDVVAELVQQRRLSRVVAELSPREREVLALMAEGRTNAAIARKFWVTPGAVEKHVRSIFRKLDLPDTPDDHRRVLAVMRYLAPSRVSRRGCARVSLALEERHAYAAQHLWCRIEHSGYLSSAWRAIRSSPLAEPWRLRTLGQRHPTWHRYSQSAT